MGRVPASHDLSAYQQFVLDKIIGTMTADSDCNIYELVQAAITNKQLLPSRNAAVMETCFAIKEYLLVHEFVTERTEMTAYRLTHKGRLLVESGSLQQFQKKTAPKRSLLAYFFNKGSKDLRIDNVKNNTTKNGHG